MARTDAMRGGDVCAGSGRRAVAGRCPICRGPAEILVSRAEHGAPMVLGWHLPWSEEPGVPNGVEWRALLRPRALTAVQRAVALAVRTQRASARAAFLVGRTAPLETGAQHEERTKALRAFSELELAARGAARVAAEAASARDQLDSLLGGDDEEPIPVERVPDAGDFVDPHTALRAAAQSAVLAATMSASVGWATESFEELADAEARDARGLAVVRALSDVRSAARDAEEVRTRTATAGRQLARAVGWESELPLLLSRARSEAGEDPEGLRAAGA